jgi:hypothetical protein
MVRNRNTDRGSMTSARCLRTHLAKIGPKGNKRIPLQRASGHGVQVSASSSHSTNQCNLPFVGCHRARRRRLMFKVLIYTSEAILQIHINTTHTTNHPCSRESSSSSDLFQIHSTNSTTSRISWSVCQGHLIVYFNGKSIVSLFTLDSPPEINARRLDKSTTACLGI